MQIKIISDGSVIRCKRLDISWPRGSDCSFFIAANRFHRRTEMCETFKYGMDGSKPVYGKCCETEDLLEVLEMLFNRLMQEERNDSRK